MKKGKIEQVMADYNKAIAIDPRNEQGYLNRSSLYFSQKNYILAMSDPTKVIEINPKDILGYYSRAASYYFLKNYDNAWADLHKAEALGFTHFDPNFISDLKKASGRDQ